jgi:hypothetical protein
MDFGGGSGFSHVRIPSPAFSATCNLLLSGGVSAIIKMYLCALARGKKIREDRPVHRYMR